MNKIYQFTLDKKILKNINQRERSLIFTLAHLYNEISVLYKLLLWTDTNQPLNEAEKLGQTTYQFMYIRLLAGKLNEGHILLSKNFYKGKLSKEYYSELSEAGRKSLDDIKKYFGKVNSVNKIRNSFAFHYSPEKLDAVYADAPDNLDLFIEHGGSANNLYYFGEIVAGRAMLKEFGELEDKFVYQKLIEEMMRVSRWIRQVSDEIISIFVKKYFINDFNEKMKEVGFDNLISTLDVIIPWFTDPTKAYKEVK